MQARAPALTSIGGLVQETSVAITWVGLPESNRRLDVDFGRHWPTPDSVEEVDAMALRLSPFQVHDRPEAKAAIVPLGRETTVCCVA